MPKSNITFTVKGLDKAIDKAFQEAQKKPIDVICPNCSSTLTTLLGENSCPRCQQKVIRELSSNKKGRSFF